MPSTVISEGTVGSTVEVSEIESLSKGDLIVGDGSGAPQTVSVGSNNAALIAASGESAGVKWANVILSDGISGGQTLNGGTAGGETITVQGNATDGVKLVGDAKGWVVNGDSALSKFHVQFGATRNMPGINTIDAVFEKTDSANDNAQFGLFSGASGRAAFVFGDTGGNNRGAVWYDNSDDSLRFGANGVSYNDATTDLVITSGNDVGVGTASPNAKLAVEGRITEQGGGAHNVETLSGNKTLATTDAKYQKLDPNGSNRDVNLPTEADSDGLSFVIFNSADGAEDLVVKEDGGTIVVTLNQDEGALVICDGTTWEHMGVETRGQS